MKIQVYLALFLFVNQVFADEVILFEEPPTTKEILESFGEPVVKTRGDKASRSILFPLLVGATVGAAVVATASANSAHKSAVQGMATNTTGHKSQQAPQKHTTIKKKPVAFPLSFSAGSAELSQDSKRYIDSIGTALNQKNDLKIHVSGHTDISGGNEINIPLSLKRAESVRNYLKSVHNVDENRVEISGEGSALPLDMRNPYSAANRRVQFERVDIN